MNIEKWDITLSEHISIIFGLTSGVLTLLGLIAIFVSLNSQHNVQKARETIWELMKYPLKLDEFNSNVEKQRKIREELNYHLFIYENIMSGGKDFTSKIIQISKMIIWIVCILWLSSLIFIENNSTQFSYILISTILAVFVMLTFIWILTKLKNIPQISKLPNYNELLDCNNHSTNLNILTLAAMLMHVQIVKLHKLVGNKIDYFFYINLPVPLHQLEIEFSPPVDSKLNYEICINEIPFPKVFISQKDLEIVQLNDEQPSYRTLIVQYTFNSQNDLMAYFEKEKNLVFRLSDGQNKTVTANLLNSTWSEPIIFPYYEEQYEEQSKKLIDFHNISVQTKTSAEKNISYDMGLERYKYYKIKTLNGNTITGQVDNLGATQIKWYYIILQDNNEKTEISLNSEDPPKIVVDLESGLMQWINPSLYHDKLLYVIYITYLNKVYFLYKSLIKNIKFVYKSIFIN